MSKVILPIYGQFLTATCTPNNFGTVSDEFLNYSMLGPNIMSLWGRFVAGTAAAATATLNLPPDFNAFFSSSGVYHVVGQYTRSAVNVAQTKTLIIQNGQSALRFGIAAAAGGFSDMVPVLGNNIAGPGEQISFWATLPVVPT